MAETLYEKYGGFSTISKIVQNFYQKVLESDPLKPYFEGVDMQRLMDHQTYFFSQILGGPLFYEENKLKEVHKHLNITEEAFAEVVELLEEALEEAGVEEGDLVTIIEVVGGTKSDIVTA